MTTDGERSRVLQVRVPAATWEQVVHLAALEHRTVSAWIRHVLYRELERHNDLLTGLDDR